MTSAKGYVTSAEPQWNYIGLDEPPPSGDIQVLTEGGISVRGNRNTIGIIAWAPLLKRDKEKEDLLKSIEGLSKEERQLAIMKFRSDRFTSKIQPKQKHCVMNCSRHINDTRSDAEFMADCTDCIFY